MVIPTRQECLVLMEHTAMPLHIRKHSLIVAEIALYLGRLLDQRCIRLNLDLVEAGALLHDIAKARSLSTGENHDHLGARMLEERGYPAVAPLVKEHVRLDWIHIEGPITESLLVNYADKRVKHDQIVTIEDRFYDLIDRYARTEEHRFGLRMKLDLYRALEKKIFDPITISPTETALMELRVDEPHNGNGGERA